MPLSRLPDEHVTRVRQLFDEAMAETFDALFEAPDIADVVSAVAVGELALVITGDSLQVVPVAASAAAPPAAEAIRPGDDFMPGMYL